MKIHSVKRWLIACWLAFLPGWVWGAPFADLTFDAASKLAAEKDEIVLIDFYTTWCQPCKMLDKTTWTDPAVIQLLQTKTVALRMDAEKEVALAGRYKISAYPSVLLLKPDGTEIDRLVGYREPKAFLADFTASLAGKDSVARAKEELEATGTDDANKRMQYATALAEKGKDAEALKEYLWCFDHGLETTPSFTGVRVSFLLNYIKNLGAHYPAAREALITRRDERQRKLTAGATDFQTAVDLVSLNKTLDQAELNIAIFDKLPAGSQGRKAVGRMIVDQLLETKRYANVLDGTDGKEGFKKQVAMFDSMAGKLPSGMATDAMKSYTVSDGAHNFEALAGLGRTEDGKELARQILAFDSSSKTREELAQAATRAGNSTLADYAKQYEAK